ncbi:anthranilate synthase component II [Hirschia baltica]|uniref:Glutamine amidotransferase of anthranilate synthase n=1 Tax=Hirschia baltica (strain ATCC 49814 / DSM 5838 / IFAM 1418) TaxID=582402 RepID=C6XJU0_HIRBI|nr:aminodeoxychorismate/anthranilate synthase component II [Hirschia baltica]ACT59385.1 glutamine amidotransferase of anthranilate synthase [Hirschia baltica ATCC 49814]
MIRGSLSRSKPNILVIDNYDSFTWNLVHYLEELGGKTDVVRNDKFSVQELLDKRPDGVILSPGPKTPQDAGVCIELLQTAPDDLPIFGVCLGHQAIGEAFGGKVISAKTILHGKTSAVTHAGGSMFKGIPKMFGAVRYHSLAVKREALPNVLKIEAETDDGEIMALSHATRPLYGVQFHPESIGSEHGHTLLSNFLNLTR